MKQFSHANLDRAFRPGEVFECPKRGQIPVRQVEVAGLFLPSGSLAACDPRHLKGKVSGIPITRMVPKGRHPVYLCLATLNNEIRAEDWVACAMLRVTSAPAVKWEMAVLPGQNFKELREGDFFGYGVDAGLGCFVDAEAVGELTVEETDALYRDRLRGELNKDGGDNDWTEIVLNPDTKANLVAFSSGTVTASTLRSGGLTSQENFAA